MPHRPAPSPRWREIRRHGNSPQGSGGYIGGMRGLVERNVMRYYLAIEAYLDALPAPPAEQLERRLQSWFTASERYPRQLHEMDRPAYIEMKRREFQRLQTIL